MKNNLFNLLRRDFLKGAGATATLSCSFSPIQSYAQASTSFVDMHCHVFNSDDLPIEGFIEKVVINGHSSYRDAVRKYGIKAGYFVRYLALSLRKQTRPALDEIDTLKDIDRGAVEPRSISEIQKAEVDLLTTWIENLRSEDAPKEFGDSIYGAYIPLTVVGLMHIEAYGPTYPNPYDQNSWQNSDILARKIYYDGRGPISRFAVWALMFSRHRYELVDRLDTIHGKRARLITPLLIDYSHWLDDDFDVRLADQIALMEAIAKRKGEMRVHPFAPFDPLRQALHVHSGNAGISPLEMIQSAVRRGAFIGVKLYPPMGFLPFGNATLGESFPRSARKVFGPGKTGRAIDAALDQLYTWCAAERVPLLAHAAESNGSAPGYEKRADPTNWKAALSTYRGLRICLAHFGHFERGFKTAEHPNPKLSDTWEFHFGKLVETFPDNVYGDLSYCVAALSNPTSGVHDAVLDMLTRIRKQFPALAQRLVFGTDWIMLGQEEGFFKKLEGEHVLATNVEYLLNRAGFSSNDIAAIMMGNAGRFLELGRSAPAGQTNNRSRLESFYQKHQISRDWLDAFNA